MAQRRTRTLPGVCPHPPQAPSIEIIPTRRRSYTPRVVSSTTLGEPRWCHQPFLSSQSPHTPPCRGTTICSPPGTTSGGSAGVLTQGFGAPTKVPVCWQRGFWHPPSPGDLLAEGWPGRASRALQDSCCLEAPMQGTLVCPLRMEASEGQPGLALGSQAVGWFIWCREARLTLGFHRHPQENSHFLHLTSTLRCWQVGKPPAEAGVPVGWHHQGRCPAPSGLRGFHARHCAAPAAGAALSGKLFPVGFGSGRMDPSHAPGR